MFTLYGDFTAFTALEIVSFATAKPSLSAAEPTAFDAVLKKMSFDYISTSFIRL